MTERLAPYRRMWLVLGAVLVASVALAEVLLRPVPADRRSLVLVLAAPAFAAVALVPILRLWVARRASVTGSVVAVGVAALALGVVASSTASKAMFVSPHDYRMFLVVLTLSSGIAVAVGGTLIRPLADDLRRLGSTVERLAAGNYAARTNVERLDEVGRTAQAIDEMASRLLAARRDQDRLAIARRDLLNNVGHDLRTPLAAIRAAVESVRDGVAPDPDAYLAVAERQVAICEQLLARLTDLARVESMPTSAPRELVHVAEVVDEAIESLTPMAAAAQVRMSASVSGQTSIDGNAFELGRAIRNLLDNAIRHSPPGEMVTVDIAGSAKHVSVEVCDRGSGFPEAFRPVAFEPFTQADGARSRAGTSGLGLAIVRAVAAAHGGTAHIVEDRPGGIGPLDRGVRRSGGTAVVITLQRAAEIASTDVGCDLPVGSMGGGQRTATVAATEAL